MDLKKLEIDLTSSDAEGRLYAWFDGFVNQSRSYIFSYLFRGLLTIGTNRTPIVRFSVTPSFDFVTITIS